MSLPLFHRRSPALHVLTNPSVWTMNYISPGKVNALDQCWRDDAARAIAILFSFLCKVVLRISAILFILIQNLLVIPKPFASQVVTPFLFVILSVVIWFVQVHRTAAVFANRGSITGRQLSRCSLSETTLHILEITRD